MNSQRPQRNRKPKVIWEAAGDHTERGIKIAVKKAPRTIKSEAFIPVAIEPLPLNAERELPTYVPQIKIRKKSGKPTFSDLSPIDTFKRFICIQIVMLVVVNTNSYAERKRQELGQDHFSCARTWKPTTIGEIYRYIGVWLYMGLHREATRQSFWSQSHQLGRYMSRNRFEQIHRYFSTRDEERYPRQPEESFAWKLEPITTLLRTSLLGNWSPGTHLAVDEAMIAFRGRTVHKVKMKNKPIDEGYKVWMAAQNGYTLTFKWHSKLEGPEGIPQEGISVPATSSTSIHIAPTFAVVLTIAQRLRDAFLTQKFHFFLDNLFLNVPVAQALLFLDILCTGTTRKNAQGVPQWLVDIKKKNQILVWDSALADIVDGVLCFLWQDNNAVLGITTAFDLFQRVQRIRKRPGITSTNARIVRPVFGDAVRKRLWIPKVIDEYNHHMGGVDLANQLRSNYTVNRPFEHRIWHPLWHFLIDITSVNAFICWRFGKPRRLRNHRSFREKLIEALLTHPLECEAVGVIPEAIDSYSGHSWSRFGKRGYCKWCQTRPRDNLARRRRVLGEIINQAAPTGRIRPGITYGGCNTCNTLLCASGSCFRRYHSLKSGEMK
jgi:Transposase IS4